MFSKRTQWSLNPNRISAKLEQLRAEGGSIIDLTQSNPTACGLIYPHMPLLTALGDPKNLCYQPSPQGMLAAREAVSAYYRQRGFAVDPEHIFLTASTSEGYSYLFRLLADPGDKILFPRPSYPLFDFLGTLNDVELSLYPLVYGEEKGWRIDFSSLQQGTGKNTKAVALVNPNNPTGSYIHDDDFARLNAFCRDTHLPVIADEVFFDFPFSPDAHFRSFVDNRENLTFVLGGLSKTLGLPQMKLSWIIIGGPADEVREARARLEIIADTYLSVNTPVQNALAQWLGVSSDIQGTILSRVRKNRRCVIEKFSFANGGCVLQAEGGWYAVLRLPEGIAEEKFTLDLLEHDGVFVHPGYFFDFTDEPYVVVSLLPPENEFEEGIRRLVKRVKDSCN